MAYSRILTAWTASLLFAVPACEGKFTSLGTDTGGSTNEAGASQAGANHAGGQGGAHQGGAGTGGKNQGGSTACPAIDLMMPNCGTSTAQPQYDANGCMTGYACPSGTGSCTCTGTHPMIANTLCSDGSTGGPVCATDTAGACSWIIRSCPPATGTGGATGAGGAPSTSGTCVYNGVTYAAGVSFRSTDGCNSCSCDATSGLVACTLMACAAGGAPSTGGASSKGGASSTASTCVYNGVTHQAGTSFASTDGCNTCSCSTSGQVACTKMACAAGGSTGTSSGGASSAGGTTSTGGTSSSGGTKATGGASGSGGTSSVCSGAISMIMPVCSSGTATMQYDASGCPTGYGCPSDVCKCTGPALGAPNVLCSDGTMGGPVCATHTDGTCAWMMRSCP